jgi:hypothetical protein
MLRNALLVSSLSALAFVASASAGLRVTEAMSSSGSGGTADWFEVSNYGTTAIDITGYKMDDNSFAFANAVALLGITSIAAGETVIFVEGASTTVSGFRSFWGGLSGVQVGYYTGSGVSFSSSGDGLVVYNGSGSEVTQRATFGSATTGSSFYFESTGTNPGVVSTVGTIGTQVTFATSGNPGNVGSLGTALNIPAPGAVALVALAGLVARRRK